jgi:hypothetical protein
LQLRIIDPIGNNLTAFDNFEKPLQIETEDHPTTRKMFQFDRFIIIHLSDETGASVLNLPGSFWIPVPAIPNSSSINGGKAVKQHTQAQAEQKEEASQTSNNVDTFIFLLIPIFYNIFSRLINRLLRLLRV